MQEGTANAREEFKGNRYALQGSGGGSTGGKGGGTTTTAKGVCCGRRKFHRRTSGEGRELTKQWSAATDQAGRDGYKKQLDEAQGILDQMRGKAKEP